MKILKILLPAMLSFRIEIFYILCNLDMKFKVGYGSYIVKGTQGEFYSCKKEIFEETYEEILDERSKNIGYSELV
ncbi:hypothetical protein [Fusobacterium necrophorum]|uniref:hypothetical protein n=1 Tax=Fusobacterium necrophorum TaxID=859 RepID=UPI00370EE659